MSGARPGARREQAEGFSTKLEDLERIGMQRRGVNYAHAVHGGRELRVYVRERDVDDLAVVEMSTRDREPDRRRDDVPRPDQGHRDPRVRSDLDRELGTSADAHCAANDRVVTGAPTNSMCAGGMRDARARRIMANQNGRNGSTHDDKEGWRKQGEPPAGRREDDDRYRMRDDDERFERGSGSHWEDRERGYGERDAERRGMGQSGYGAGRSADDRSMGTQARNTAWSGTHADRGTDDRWTGRGGQSWGEERGERDYGRGRWEEGRIGMSQGYGYQDGDRPSFERGIHDTRSGGSREQPGSGGPYGGGGYEPDRRSFGSREQNRHGAMGYGQHQTGFGGAQGLDLRRGPHRGKGPKGFEPSDDRIRERVCEALADDHNIDATNIEVSVHKGEVTLSGAVDDRETKRMAEDCVLQCSGVRDVHNQLRVHR